jgi:signal transduction histidine kinase
MGATQPVLPRRSVANGALLVLVLGLVALTALVVAVPSVDPAAVNDRLDIAAVTAATLVSTAVAALDWARARIGHDPAALLRAAAFLVLAALNAMTLLAAITGADRGLGVALSDPGQLPLYATIAGRGIAAVALIGAGAAALTRWRPPGPAGVVLLAPATLFGLALLVFIGLRGSLPAIAPDDVLASLIASPTKALPLGAAPILVVAQGIVGAGFVAAAVLAHRSFRRSGLASDGLFTAGLLIAAFSQVHSAIHPGSYTSVVTVGDLLRLAFFGVLLTGIVVESRQDLANLRAATREVRRLAEAEFAAVAMAERGRMAREIHDGLAQDLWYAKLKHTRLSQLAGYDAAQRELSDEVESAIDAALAEARNAIAVMREGADAGPFLDVLQRQVDDFADRFAIRADLEAIGRPPDLTPRAQVEILRIVQEALTNVRRHADATVVRINVHTDGELRITIADNGRGFDPRQSPSGFGLESMAQRAQLIGATFHVESEPRNGTRIRLALPGTPVEERGTTDGR